MLDEERRITTRVPAEFEVSYVHEDDYVISFSKDLSAEGMFIHTENPPNVGEITRISFSIGDLYNIKVDARVIWINQTENKKDTGMGVQFMDTTPEFRDAILEIVHKIALI